MGARKLKSKRFLKNTFHRKRHGDLISQLKNPHTKSSRF